MNILLVGALAWNPERVIALSNRGHRLFGLWSRTMAWEQGPYAFADGFIRDVDLEQALDLLHDRSIDFVYSLFQVYDPALWAAESGPGVEDVWNQLRQLLLERSRGTFNVPIVKHWGFDVHNLDLDVVRALDGQIFCNRQKLNYWTQPRTAGGCGLDLGCHDQEVTFMDSDLPSREFMSDRFAPKLSAADGEIHTVCVGRPLGIDVVRAARQGIHVHLYGNSVDDTAEIIARETSPGGYRHLQSAVQTHVHVHPSIQPADSTLAAIRSAKARWVEEFSRYDAGWSYVGLPFLWDHLEDQAVIPNRVGTYLLAGLPIIAEKLPGFYRYDVLAEQGVAIDFNPDDYEGLARDLRRGDLVVEAGDRAQRCREQFSFEATLDPLVDYFERVRERFQHREARPAIAIGQPRSQRVRLYTRPQPFREIFGARGGPDGLPGRMGIQRRLAGSWVRSAFSRAIGKRRVSQWLEGRGEAR